jgi:hypothetical protein
MSKKTIPVTLAELDGTEESAQGSVIHENTLPKDLAFGNKCFHSKFNPKEYKSPSHHTSKPYQIEKPKKGFRKFYDKSLKLFERDLRSERREAIMLVGQCIIDFTDLLTNEVKHLTIYKIIKLTGLGVRRVIRAIRELKKAGYIFVQRCWKQSKDRFIGLPSIRVISDSLLLALGLKHKELSKYRKRKALEQRSKDIEAQSLNNFYETQKALTNHHDYKALIGRKIDTNAKTVTELIALCKLIPMRS